MPFKHLFFTLCASFVLCACNKSQGYDEIVDLPYPHREYYGEQSKRENGLKMKLMLGTSSYAQMLYGNNLDKVDLFEAVFSLR